MNSPISSRAQRGLLGILLWIILGNNPSHGIGADHQRPPNHPSETSAGQSVDTDHYLKTVKQQLIQVAEFQFLKKEAENLGIRVWLFGGTAAAYAHYVKWDLLQQGGTRATKKTVLTTIIQIYFAVLRI